MFDERSTPAVRASALTRDDWVSAIAGFQHTSVNRRAGPTAPWRSLLLQASKPHARHGGFLKRQALRRFRISPKQSQLFFEVHPPHGVQLRVYHYRRRDGRIAGFPVDGGVVDRGPTPVHFLYDFSYGWIGGY
jgi:hypothetical protein